MTGRAFLLCCIVAVCGLQAVAGAEKPVQWIVVTAPDFVDALVPLVEHRRAEGFDVVVVQTTDVLSGEQIAQGRGEPLQEHLGQLCRQTDQTSTILLVGAMTATDAGAAARTVVPSLQGTTGRMQGRPSDNGYGCLGDDLMPTVAVGRFPARTVAEAEVMVRKTLELENAAGGQAWQNRLVMIVGNPGGSGWLEKRFAEWFIEAAGKTRMDQLHPSWSVRAIIHSASSPFNVPSEQLRDTAVSYLEEGEMFSFYLGHSSAYSLSSDGTGFLSRDDWAKLDIPQGRGVFFTCGCYACQLTGLAGEGYGWTAMRGPGGPTAVIGAYGESYAAMGQLALDGLLQHLTQPPEPMRLGTFWLAAKAGLAEGPISSVMFQLYDQVDGSRGKTPLDVQRLEHLEMWTLLGDPALRLPIQPLDIEPAAGSDGRPGG